MLWIASAMAIFIGLLSLAAAPGYGLLAAVTLAIGLGSVALGFFLWWLTRALRRGSVLARWITLVVEVLGAAGGAALYALAMDAQAHAGTAANPGTDGPFADGGVGILALTGLLFMIGGAVVTMLLGVLPGVRRLRRSD